MAKSFYAALIGISIDKGEIDSLDDKVSKYLDYFEDDRDIVTIRDILNMTSGLEFPKSEHENMFFRNDQMAYVRSIGMEKSPGTVFEYNNVNSMILGDILLEATGMKADILLQERVFNADTLLEERILKKIDMDNVTLWKDATGNPLTYCCMDATVRQYGKFGLLFSRGGKWQDQQVVPSQFVAQTFQHQWRDIPSDSLQIQRGYSLHWWISRYEKEAKIFNASGKFGQYIFVDHKNDIIFTRITKYHPMPGSTQNWGFLKYLDINNVDLWINVLRFMHQIGIIDLSKDITTPNTFPDGESKEFYTNYGSIIDAMADLSRD